MFYNPIGMNVLASSTPQGGVLVTNILKNGPAAVQAGIRVGDELLEINSKPLTGLTQSEVLSLLFSLTGDMLFIIIRTPDRLESLAVVNDNMNAGQTRKLDQVNLILYSQSNTLLIGTPGDRPNMFVLSGIRINRSHLHAFV